MIRNAVIHISNEQPLLADLFELPSASDVGLRCTNLRTLDGKRPIFVDHVESVFFFPYVHIRFVEIPRGAADAVPGDSSAGEPAAAAPGARDSGGSTAESGPEPDLEIDEEFLRRIRDV